MAVKHKYLNLFFALAPLVCFSQNMPPSTKPDPAHIGPLAPDPHGKTTAQHPQPKLAEVSEAMGARTFRVSVIDPKIPGISMDEQYIRNASDRAVIALVVRCEYTDGTTVRFHEDGLTTPFEGIPGHGGSMYSPNSGGLKGGDLKSLSIEWLLFSDGSFYGSQQDAEALAVKARVRKQFYVDLMRAQDREAFLAPLEKCGQDVECAKASGRPYNEWNELNRVIRGYRKHDRMYRQNGRSEEILKRFALAHKSYPPIRRVTPLPVTSASGSVKPESQADGWEFFSLTATCNQLAPPAMSTISGNNAGTISGAYNTTIDSPHGRCGYSTFDNPASRQTTFGALIIDPGGDKLTSGVFRVEAKASCYNVDTLKTRPINPFFSQGTLISGSVIQWAPRYYAETEINTDWTPSWDGSTLTFSVAFGWDETKSPLAQLDPGHTDVFVRYRPPFGLYPNNTISGLPGAGTGPTGLSLIPLLGPNTTDALILNSYGYMIANYEADYHCATGDYVADVSPAVTIDPPPYAARFGIVAWPKIHNGPVDLRIDHYQATNEANNIGVCDAVHEFCCCMSTFGDLNYCLWLGLPPSDSCSIVAAARSHLQTLGVSYSPTGDSGGFAGGNRAPSKLGVARRSSQIFMLDSTGLNQYQAGVTKIDTFIPPGGIQAGDVPVSGDWNGNGQTKVGFFRNGTWYLDQNGNGIWDGVAGGDLQYQFGGGIAPFGQPNTSGYVPGDVPIVGDWQGGGKDCVGVFRYGYFWIIDSNCDGAYQTGDNAFSFGGILGDTPVIGKWGGFSNSQVGVVRCYIDPTTNVCSGAPYYWVLDAGSPMSAWHGVGQGIGCGLSNPLSWSQCVTPAPFAFGGLNGDVYLSGDWVGTGVSFPGLYRNGQWVLDLDGTQQHLQTYNFGGLSGDVPLVGKW